MAVVNSLSQIRLEWNIQNFSQFSNKDYSVESPILECKELSSNDWYFRIFSYCPSEKRILAVNFVRCIHDCLEPTVYVNFEYSFLSFDKEPLFTKTFLVNLDDGSNETTSCCPPHIPGPTLEEVFETRRLEYLPGDELTVLLRLWRSNQDKVERRFAQTVLGTKKTCYEWQIERYQSLQLNELVTHSLSFTDSSHYYAISFNLVGSSLEDATVNIEITLLRGKSTVSCKISLSDFEERTLKFLEYFHEFGHFDNGSTWVFPMFLKWSEILDKCWGEEDLCLIIKFEEHDFHHLSSLYDKLSALKSISKDCSPQLQDGSVLKLLKDLRSLYQEQTLSDFELRSEGVNFPVHKAVLSARSPVFKSMFSNGMKESNSNFLDILDIDSLTLNRMLIFLYGGTMEPELRWDNAAKLYYAADKYQVQSLKQQCSALILSSITMSNVCDILALADRHNDEEFKSSVHEFLFAHLDDIIYSTEWEEFEEKNLKLAAVTMRLMIKELTVKKYDDICAEC